MDGLITYILEGVFFVVLGVVFLRYLRRPSALNRDVLAVFASVAGLFLFDILGDLLPELPGTQTAAAVLLMAQPYLALRLTGHFAPLDRTIEDIVILGLLAAVAWVMLGVSGDALGITFVVAFFVATNTFAGYRFVRAARSRIGSARTRLTTAGAATLLFGLAVLIAGGAGAAAAAGGREAPAEASRAGSLVALLAGVGYLLAFAPPRWMRRIGQQALAFELNEELLTLPPGSEAAGIWSRLAASSRRITGGRAAVVLDADGVVLAEDGAWSVRPVVGMALSSIETLRSRSAPRVIETPTGALADLARSAGADRAVSVPLSGWSGRRGLLVVLVPGSPLFLEDDLALLRTLGGLTLAAVEREEALEERSRLVADLRQTNEDLSRANAAKSDFLAAMSHELRTPLNSIIGFSELLMAPLGPVESRRGLDVVDQAGHIHSAGLQLLDLINEVLDLARVEAGRLELRYDRFDLTELVSRTVDSMSPLADRRALVVGVEGEPLEVEADPARLRQVIYNLLANALKFSPQGGRVRVLIGAGEGEASVSISDEGPGIPVTEQALVFEAFGQGQEGRLRSEGTGLGLALARQLVEAHGGRLELASEPPAGATFTFHVPLRRPAAGQEPSAEHPDRLVLAIEDDAGMVALLRSWLEPEGYALRSAGDGESGLELARRLVPDAILLDILLPGLDGWDVLQRLRLEPRTRGVPILVLSVVDDQQLGLALGAADYLVKPLDRQQLVERLHRALGAGPTAEPFVVLAIDADEEDRAAYREILNGSARLVEAPSGASALALAVRTTPDAILLDLGLEDVSPFALLADIRAHPATRDVPVFALTRHPLDEEVKRRLTGQVVTVLERDDVAGELSAWLMSQAPRGERGDAVPA